MPPLIFILFSYPFNNLNTKKVPLQISIQDEMLKSKKKLKPIDINNKDDKLQRSRLEKGYNLMKRTYNPSKIKRARKCGFRKKCLLLMDVLF